MIIGTVKINNYKINGVFKEGVPVPDMDRMNATLKYIYDLENQGQKIIEKSYYGSNEPNEYTIELFDNGLIFNYEAKIYNYELDLETMQASVRLKLCGSFTFERGFGADKVTIKKDFSRR
jgi:hypothetical protein